MHVAVRDADEPGRDAGASELDRVGVVAGGAPERGELVRDLLALRDRDQPLAHHRVHVRPARDHRSAAQPHVAFLVLVDGRAIGGVGHVDRDADVRIDAVGARARAAQPDLLLHRRDREHRAAQLLLLGRVRIRRAASMHDPEPGLVVHAGGVGEVVAHLLEAELERDRITDAHELLRLRARLHSDVEPEVLRLHHLLALLVLEQVDRLARDHRRQRTASWSTQSCAAR